MDKLSIKTVVWVGPSRKDLKEFPRPVQRAVGLALYAAQLGETPLDAKVLKGFGGAGVLELVEDHRGDAYRAVYTVRFASKICVLHAFQKKSKGGVATPQKEIELIRTRLNGPRACTQGKPRRAEPWRPHTKKAAATSLPILASPIPSRNWSRPS